MLPDEVLLAIFYFLVDKQQYAEKIQVLYMRGCHWCTCVGNGDALFWDHHVASICYFLQTDNAREGHAGCLADFASYH